MSDELYDTQKDRDRWKTNAIDFAQTSREITNKLILERNEARQERDDLKSLLDEAIADRNAWFRVADMFYLCVDGASEEYVRAFSKYHLERHEPHQNVSKANLFRALEACGNEIARLKQICDDLYNGRSGAFDRFDSGMQAYEEYTRHENKKAN